MKQRSDRAPRPGGDVPVRGGGDPTEAGPRGAGAVAVDSELQERITKLEARIDATPGATDAHVHALRTGLRVVVVELIRRRRQAERTCESLTRVLEATSDGFVALDADWHYTYVNEHAGRMFGRDPASLVGKHIWTEFPEGVGQPFHLAYERAVAEGQPQQIEAFYPPYGRWFENRIFPYAGGVAIFFQDVTERRLAADRLRESEQRYRSLFDHHPDAVYSFDLDGRFESANDACEAITGYRPDALLGRTFLPLIVPEHRDAAAEHFRAALGGSARSYEEAIIHKTGRRVEIGITKLPIVVDGKVVGVYGIARDLTGQRQLEAQLLQAQKMEAVGRLAGGIAHDFNNLLTVIQSAAMFLGAGVGDNPSLQADVQEVLKATGRATELTQRLLAFSRKQVLQPQLLDVNARVAGFAAMLRRLIGEDVAIETDLDPETGPVSADPGQLEQVLMNLAVNARDAMPGGGTLRLMTRNVVVEPGSSRAQAGLDAGPYVSIRVEDTGTGIDADVLPHIFEPFVTTKAPGVGTGLGLATAQGIVGQSHGTIEVESIPGRGSRFSVLLPRAQGEAAEETAPAAPSMMPGTGSILLVEDDEAVRTIVRRMLEAQGYAVREAANPPEAMRLLEESAAEVDLVLTDVVLPEQNGRVLADRIAARWPALKVLFMSGYTDDEIIRRGLMEPGTTFLAKPFSPDPLARAVREALGGAPRAGGAPGQSIGERRA